MQCKTSASDLCFLKHLGWVMTVRYNETTVTRHAFQCEQSPPGCSGDRRSPKPEESCHQFRSVQTREANYPAMWLMNANGRILQSSPKCPKPIQTIFSPVDFTFFLQTTVRASGVTCGVTCGLVWWSFLEPGSGTRCQASTSTANPTAWQTQRCGAVVFLKLHLELLDARRCSKMLAFLMLF